MWKTFPVFSELSGQLSTGKTALSTEKSGNRQEKRAKQREKQINIHFIHIHIKPLIVEKKEQVLFCTFYSPFMPNLGIMTFCGEIPSFFR